MMHTVNIHRGRLIVQQDIFGDLTRKDEVLLMLQEIADGGRLDEHQIGLARILRFRENHRLLHVVLEYAVRIEQPSDILIAEAVNVLVAQELPVSIRALSAGALGHLLARRPQRTDSDFDIDKVMDTMVHVLYKSESPALKKALFKALGVARASGNAGRRRSSPRSVETRLY